MEIGIHDPGPGLAKRFLALFGPQRGAESRGVLGSETSYEAVNNEPNEPVQGIVPPPFGLKVSLRAQCALIVAVRISLAKLAREIVQVLCFKRNRGRPSTGGSLRSVSVPRSFF